MSTTPLRIALVGPAGAGKDYFVHHLQARGLRVLRVAFADELKSRAAWWLLCQIDGPPINLHDRDARIAWIDSLKTRPQMRAFLQVYGEVLCALEGELYWAEIAARRYREALKREEWDAVVITDCRKRVEAQYARADGFVLVRIVRTDGYQTSGITPETASHRSEVEQRAILTDYTLVNDGTDAYGAAIDALIARLRLAEGVTV